MCEIICVLSVVLWLPLRVCALVMGVLKSERAHCSEWTRHGFGSAGFRARIRACASVMAMERCRCAYIGECVSANLWTFNGFVVTCIIMCSGYLRSESAYCSE